MARINRFYLLIAGLMMSKTYSVSANDGYVPSTINLLEDYCAREGYVGESDGGPCVICVPMTKQSISELDDFLEEWRDVRTVINGKSVAPLADMCAPSDCRINITSNGNYPYVYFLGATSEEKNGKYYKCTADGWREISTNPTPTCPDKSVYGGTYKDCCNPYQTGSQWKCSSYSEKFCNAGYYGTFDGKSTDCTSCPDGPAIASNPSVKRTGHSLAGENFTITDCFIGAGAQKLVDDTGTFVLAGSCWW